jgi:cell division protein FtsI (penicillin-binding protein 3)
VGSPAGAPAHEPAEASAKAKRAATSVRSVRYSTSPLLASRTPPWRSKFLVALVGLSFCVLLGRASMCRSSARRSS